MTSRISVAIAALVAVAAAGTPALAQAPETASKAAARWARIPSGEEFSALYPDRAMREGVGGKAILTCRIAAEGLLTACTVKVTDGEGYGFDKSALLLSEKFQLRIPSPDGKAVGQEIVVPITFNAPPSESMGPGVQKGFGDGAAALVRLPENQSPASGSTFVIDCPDGAGRCLVRPIAWAQRPQGAEAAALLDRAGRSGGLTVADCRIAADGSLQNCRIDQARSPETEAVVTEILSKMRAAPKTLDGGSSEGLEVQIPFQWDWLITSMKGDR